MCRGLGPSEGVGGAPWPTVPGRPRSPPLPVLQPQPLCSPQPCRRPPQPGPHRRSSPASADLLLLGTWPAGMGARLRPRAGVPLPATRSQRRRPPRSSAPHLPSSGPGAPASPRLASSEVALGPLVVGAPALNSAARGRCSPGPALHPPTRGAITLCPFAAPLPEGLRQPDPQRAPLACTPHPISPGYILLPRSLCQESSIPGLGAPGVSGESRWLPRPVSAPTAALPLWLEGGLPPK